MEENLTYMNDVQNSTASVTSKLCKVKLLQIQDSWTTLTMYFRFLLSSKYIFVCAEYWGGYVRFLLKIILT